MGNYDVAGGENAFDEIDNTTLSYNVDGLIVGGQLGYNWQRGNYVFGVEGELGFLNADGNKLDEDNFAKTEFDAYGLLDGRLGFTSDRALFYVKGGWALAKVKTKAGDLDADVVDEIDVTQLNKTLSGYAIGGGVEYALSQNWTVKAEYLYMNFGNENSKNADEEAYSHDIDLHTAKIGVNYRIGGDYDALK